MSGLSDKTDGQTMRRFMSILLFMNVTILLVAQSNIRMNNYWDNTYYINPGSINDEYQAVFSLAARKQWLGFPGSPNTAFASATTYLNQIQTQFGVKVFADKLGYNTISNIALSYSYAAILNREWQLNMGISGSFQSLSYDKAQVNMMTADDPALYENLLHQNNYNTDVGAELVNKSWKIGASGLNLLSLFYDENKLQVNSNYLYAMYRKRTKKPVELQYGICGIHYGNLNQMEFNITTFFKSFQETDMLHIGLFYRTRTEMGLLVGWNLSESLQLSYSYDFNVSGISRASIGTHEIMLIYKLNKIAFKPYRY